jgi:hypothetical protein
MKQIFALCLCCALSALLPAQNTPAPTLNVFLDYFYGPVDFNYLKTEVRFVNYVSDRSLADVQVQSIVIPIGNGAAQLEYVFRGYGVFEGQTDTIHWHIDPLENAGSLREKSARALKRGLLPYLLQTDAAELIDYQIGNAPDYVATKDPWNLWTFKVALDGQANGGYSENSFSGIEKTKASISNYFFQPTFNIWRIGEKWRGGFDINYYYRQSRSYRRPVTTTADVVNSTQSLDFNLYYVRAIRQHWAWGVSFRGNTNGEPLQRFDLRSNAGFEYNVYPYREFFHRRLLFGYLLRTVVFNEAYDLQIANSNKSRFTNYCYGSYDRISSWGAFGANLGVEYGFAQFWNNYTLNAGTQTAINLGKNIFLRLSASVIYGNNDYTFYGSSGFPIVFSQKFRNLTYNSSIGIAYFFGSGYRSIVNPRLGGI